MKKRISALVALLVLALAVLQVPAAMADITVVRLTKGASVRSEPGFNGEKLELATLGTEYPYVGEQNGWYEVALDDARTGFLPKDACKLETAAGIPTDNPQDAFRSIAATLQAGKGFVQELPEAFAGKTALAVYSDLNLPADEISTEKLAADGYYWEIPDSMLAARMDEADWALLVYAKATDAEDNPLNLYVFPVDVKNTVYYEPYNMDDRATVLSDGEKTTDIALTLTGMKEGILWPKWEAAIRLANDENYQAGLKFMNEGKYFSAYEAFQTSGAEEALEMAEKCAQPWPGTGEIWHNASVKGSNMELVVKVNQEDDQAMVVKIYRGNAHAATAFIGGTGQVTCKLPAGTYVIKDGTGSIWYGKEELFGRYGNYETMTFGDNDDTEIKLDNGHRYTITINVTESDPNAEGVGSVYQEWDDF